MISRRSVVLGLIILEGAVVCEMVIAVRGPHPGGWPVRPAVAEAATGPTLAEGGPHRTFTVGPNPLLTIDIGHADLTIRSGSSSNVDVALAPSNDFAFMRETAPFTATQDGNALRISVQGQHDWAAGDDRMLTLEVPPETRLTVVEAGDIIVDGLRADASIRSKHGRITVEDFNAPSLRVSASEGRITLHGVAAPHLDVDTSDGRIEAEAVTARDGAIESSDGRVSVDFASGTNAVVTADTSDGSVKLAGFPTAAASPAENDGDDDNDAERRVVHIGESEGHFIVHSSDGDVSLSQS